MKTYLGEEVELVGYTTCGGCPGGNVEYAPAEMKKNGAEVIHLATGLAVGYPPCPRLQAFCDFIPAKYGLEVVIGTHPIPQNYYLTHQELGTWQSARWQEYIQHVLTERNTFSVRLTTEGGELYAKIRWNRATRPRSDDRAWRGVLRAGNP